MAVVKTIAIDSIRRDGGTQFRASMNAANIETYSDDMLRGDQFPPPIVYYDGDDHWLCDGFHRVVAYEAIGRKRIDVEVRKGSRIDAVWNSSVLNLRHGTRATNRDKQKAVARFLSIPEIADRKSDREIAAACGVHYTTVFKLREKLSVENQQIEQRRGMTDEFATTRGNAPTRQRDVVRNVNGKVQTYTMDLPPRKTDDQRTERARVKAKGRRAADAAKLGSAIKTLATAPMAPEEIPAAVYAWDRRDWANTETIAKAIDFLTQTMEALSE